ncbi:hypothetical protein TL16_g07690 [Triparma laevis f. inornata]|uniref:RING-type domain-containing protein n=1 Tax=Triparma laevis f. inornata TaxID=1714386 RepID=A0A9W7AUM0_9STRA|nr:hypothetical protein TL16_g07690 [Triparma laevis f. inornata]
MKKPPASLPPAPPVPLNISFEEEEEDEDKCIICIDNIVNVKLRPCGHSATCRECTEQLRGKEVFDVLDIGNARDVGPDLPLERQVLVITKSEDLVKLRALAKLCSKGFFDDPSLLVVAWRRMLEVLVLAMPPVVEKKARGKKKQKQKKKADPMKLEILDACLALGKACGFVGDFDDSRRYFKRAKEG